MSQPPALRVGALLDEYCGGAFDRDFGIDRVEAIGADWVVARDRDGRPRFFEGDPESLVQYVRSSREERE